MKRENMTPCCPICGSDYVTPIAPVYEESRFQCLDCEEVFTVEDEEGFIPQ